MAGRTNIILLGLYQACDENLLDSSDSSVVRLDANHYSTSNNH